jgi:TolB-like protein
MIAESQQADTTSGREFDDSALRPHAAAMLAYLRARPGDVVSKEELLDAVWPETHVSENSLYQCVSELRRALKDHAGMALQTVPRRGYRLVVEESAARAPVGSVGRRRTFWLSGVAALVALAVLLGQWWGHSRQHRAGGMPSVVVQDFAVPGGGREWQVFGASLGREVAGAMASNAWLRVHAPENASAARFVLDGSLLVREGRLFISAQLTERHSGELVWSGRWNGTETEFFDLQAMVAHEAAAELGGHWSGAVVRFDARKAARRPTESLDAYALFLRGTQAKHRFTPESFEEARQLLTRAVEIDPAFVDAWTTLSVVHNLRALTETDLARLHDILAERAHAVEAAVRLAPEDPTVLMEQGWLLARSGDHAAAERAVRRAVESAPDNPDVLAYAALNGNLRVDLGDEGVRWVARARELNPDPPPWYSIAEGLSRFTARDWDGAVEAFAQAPDYVTRHLFTAVALVQLGRDEAAQEVADRLWAQYPGFRTAYYVFQEGMDMEVNGRILLDATAELGLPVVPPLSPRASEGASLD